MTPKAASPRGSRRFVLWAVLALGGLGLVMGGRRAWRILTRPQELFASAAPQPTRTPLLPAFPVAQSTEAAENSAPETPTPTEGPHILNVMLMGIDAYESGGTTSGTMPHTDVMLVIAVNFDADTVDLITLPRDIMTRAPDHYGIYKLNGVFNVGLGGWEKPAGQAEELKAGFLLTCQAGEAWLGGVSIPYYYAVDFQAVIDMVDAIGGIDYDVDQPFTAMSGKRSYKKGMQHLDGDAVLGYLRIRRDADGLDSSRTARQRRMLVAIFNKLRTESKLSQIPALIAAVNSGVYTNTSLSQTTALVNYAMTLPEDSIRTRAMYGEIGTIEFDWRYVYVDQQNRLDLIREVYGIDAQPMGLDTRQYERWLHRVGFLAMKHLRQAEKVLTAMQARKDAGQVFSDADMDLYADCYQAYTVLQAGIDGADDALTPRYAAAPWREKRSDSRSWTRENRAEDRELTALEDELFAALTDLMAASRTATVRLADALSLRDLSWTVPKKWYNDPDINEVVVHFG